MTENKLSGLAAYAVPYALYFILSVNSAAGGTGTTLYIGLSSNHQRQIALSKSQLV